jgi:hypothetical protein
VWKIEDRSIAIRKEHSSFVFCSQSMMTTMMHDHYQQPREERTSLITILSCEHGRLRREQRDIEKRDLQKALKYGRRSKCWGKRWMIEYDGIVFITDQSLTREITAYPAPLAYAPIFHDGKATADHEKAKLLLEKKPKLASSHTVLVIDNSGSMLTHDIHLHRDRQTAAYTETALELVAEQLFRNTANNRDLVSLVEFHSSAEIVFSREPISWVLYNKLLARRDSRLFKDREVAKSLDVQVSQGDSNYLPALALARQLLGTGMHETCALSLFFLSDGAPSDDAAGLNRTPQETKSIICQCVADIASQFGNQLNMTMIGFGNAFADFHTLYAMAEAGKAAPGGATAEFVYCDKIARCIGEAVTSLTTSLCKTRLSLSNAAPRRYQYTKRIISAERWTRTRSDWQYFRILNHYVYSPRRGVFQYSGFPCGAITDENNDMSIQMKQNPPMLLAMRTIPCGEGVERVAFHCQLAYTTNPRSFVLQPMVAKETNFQERIGENVRFHKSFLKSKSLAMVLAQEFNKRICALPDYHEQWTPRLTFLPCSILLVKDPSWPNNGGVRDVLVEKRLNVEKFPWTKWNNNAGQVANGGSATPALLMPLDVDYELARLETSSGDMELSEILEGDEESDSSDDDEDDDEKSLLADDDDDDVSMTQDDTHSMGSDNPFDYLQAFTHFTYLYTNKKVMVCDLQGIFNTDLVPPTFELSDPAIHYASKQRKEVYGCTDKGRKGMQLFFNTHKCTRICKMMQLSAKNKQWRKHWQGAEFYA